MTSSAALGAVVIPPTHEIGVQRRCGEAVGEVLVPNSTCMFCYTSITRMPVATVDICLRATSVCACQGRATASRG